jgi:hypothetical protein
MVLSGDNGVAGEFQLASSGERMTANYSNGTDSFDFVLPSDFDPFAIHGVSLEIDGRYLKVSLDACVLNFTSAFAGDVSEIAFDADKSSIEISSLSITGGFEVLFEEDALDLRGWTLNGERPFRYQDLNLIAVGDDGRVAEMQRKMPPGNCEVCINLRVDKFAADISSVGIQLSEMFEIRPTQRVITVGQWTFDLPEDFSTDAFNQFRFVCIDGRTSIHVDTVFLGEVSHAGFDALSIVVKHAEVAFDMIRHTLI